MHKHYFFLAPLQQQLRKNLRLPGNDIIKLLSYVRIISLKWKTEDADFTDTCKLTLYLNVNC